MTINKADAAVAALRFLTYRAQGSTYSECCSLLGLTPGLLKEALQRAVQDGAITREDLEEVTPQGTETKNHVQDKENQ